MISEFQVRQKKSDYNTSLRNLERISDSIHEQRSIGAASLASERGSHAQLSNLATGQTSAKTQSLTASSSSSRLEAPPANPPAYVPTAPPPYEDDGRYEIEKVRDSYNFWNIIYNGSLYLMEILQKLLLFLKICITYLKYCNRTIHHHQQICNL